MELLILALLVAALIIGELVFRRIPGGGGLLYNMSGTIAGLFWILAGVFFAYGGSYLLGFLLVIIGVNIHRSNYRTVKRTMGSRQTLNG